MIMRKRKELKRKNPNLFINEDLTRERMSILDTQEHWTSHNLEDLDHRRRRIYQTDRHK